MTTNTNNRYLINDENDNEFISSNEDNNYLECEFISSNEDDNNYPFKDNAAYMVNTDRLTLKDSFNIFGIELEAICRKSYTTKKNEALKYFHITDDGSLEGDTGREFVTTPLPIDKGIDIIKNFIKDMGKKLDVNRSCGFHVHLYVDKEHQTLDMMKKIMYAYYKLELLFFLSQPTSRRNNTYCRSLKEYNNLERLLKKKTLATFLRSYYKRYNIMTTRDIPHDKYFYKRYEWVNLHSIFYRNTIEIRLHSGTLNTNKIINWIMINKTLLEWLLKTDLKTVKDTLTENYFLDNILTKKLKKHMIDRIKEHRISYDFTQDINPTQKTKWLEEIDMYTKIGINLDTKFKEGVLKDV